MTDKMLTGIIIITFAIVLTNSPLCHGSFVGRFPQNREPVYMLASKRDSVVRIDLNEFNRVETLPLPLTRESIVVSVECDPRTNTIFWSDLHNHTISKMQMDGGENAAEHLVVDAALSVEGLAFDWVSNKLYFTDGSKSTIEVVTVDSPFTRRRLLTKPQVDNPRGIAVHPKKGYIFWTDWSIQYPGIGRANLDGSNVKILVNNPVDVQWPNGITIDYVHNRLFWVDAKLDKIFTSDLNGGDLQVVVANNKVGHPFGVGVYRSTVYWNDWITRGIYGGPMERLQQGSNFAVNPRSIFVVKSDVPRMLGLKVYGRSF